MLKKRDLLSKVKFGERVAEDEAGLLTSYFVETNIWEKLQAGKLDIIYGAKGSGKSALYAHLLQKKDEFFSRNILLIPAEELTGAPAFKEVFRDDYGVELNTFRHIWYIYALTLIGNHLQQFTGRNEKVDDFVLRLQREGLLGADSLRAILSRAKNYVSSVFKKLKSIETSVSYDTSGNSTITGRITMYEPSEDERKVGIVSAIDLINLAEEALEQLNMTIWILFDRLDVAFYRQQTEKTALKSLFRVYNDLKGRKRIKFKIFIRDDLWRRISDDGFREASHITSQVTITWKKSDLLYLIVSRILENKLLRDYFKVKKSDILTDADKQKEFFKRVFPEKIESGKNPFSFEWMVSRVQDGLGNTTPREIIHLINAAKEVQIRKLETGVPENSFSELISRAAIKDALEEVSCTKIEQTIYQEYPDLKPYIQALGKRKTEQYINTLSKIFKTPPNETTKIVHQLMEIGFFAEKKSKKGQVSYWVPFIFRPALEMVQGKESITTGRIPKEPKKPLHPQLLLFEEVDS